jgi:hypothetical protein
LPAGKIEADELTNVLKRSLKIDCLQAEVKLMSFWCPQNDCLLTGTTQKHALMSSDQSHADTGPCACWCPQNKTPVGKSQAAALAGGLRAKCLQTKTKPMNATCADKGPADELTEDLREICRCRKTRA